MYIQRDVFIKNEREEQREERKERLREMDKSVTDGGRRGLVTSYVPKCIRLKEYKQTDCI